MTNPATVTKSIGLLADPTLRSGQARRCDRSLPERLETVISAGQIRAVIGALATGQLFSGRHVDLSLSVGTMRTNTANPTFGPAQGQLDGNSLYRRAVRLSKNLPCLFISMKLVILEKVEGFVS